MQIINNTKHTQILVEKSRQEYAATLYAAAALAHIAIIVASDAVDELQENCASLVRHQVRRSLCLIPKEISKLNKAINAQMKGDKESVWMCDFGNAAYSIIEPHCKKLHVAISNFLGKYPKVADRQTFASVIIAQSIASEAKTYVDNTSKKFVEYNVIGKDGFKYSAQAVVQSLSCAALRHHLTVIADSLLTPCLPKDTNILSDPAIYCGCKAIINCLINPKTWAEAREKAEKFNNLN